MVWFTTRRILNGGDALNGELFTVRFSAYEVQRGMLFWCSGLIPTRKGSCHEGANVRMSILNRTRK